VHTPDNLTILRRCKLTISHRFIREEVSYEDCSETPTLDVQIGPGLFFNHGTQRTKFGTHSKVSYDTKAELCIKT